MELGLGESRSYQNPILGSIAGLLTAIIPSARKTEPDCDYLLLLICNSQIIQQI